MQALHELDEGRLLLLRNQTLEFLDAHDDNRIMTADADALGTFGPRVTHDFAEARFCVFELPSSLRYCLGHSRSSFRHDIRASQLVRR
ncbi:hypothetical protein BOSE62_190020 [Bosea sp. 62]|nr:hypothetical protein BOSE21B_150031 [Bosea sp. 21B]CAD5291722.1 hypothetical protein BOSE46_70628 [Bosea sp. 46]CAD5300674.1 hypothetical protein BOSE7B_90058 [Bosea sp. 7B]VVT60746.1 hypothetical protein BOS5A_230023 [Bosea sp. EC-HK365B]VXC04787.1 hypothetical protein BOSE62_190020 [Bosea sp. 62]VXC51101.1 hypothetical protein BOSE125_270002 [Bosea sp. 125]VXC59893.1 hypothetical protein BOSE127_230031 [Bosea sp. 127]VXC66598.1 hypothetical protein BOSE29B_50597 [Bosea sp. 29B]